LFGTAVKTIDPTTVVKIRTSSKTPLRGNMGKTQAPDQNLVKGGKKIERRNVSDIAAVTGA
jgi:hypothetical protein